MAERMFFNRQGQALIWNANMLVLLDDVPINVYAGTDGSGPPK
jgi:hypothetical protein